MNKKYYIFEMNIKILNIISLLLLFIVAPIGYLLYPEAFNISEEFNFVLFIVIYFLYMFLHELLHSLSYVIHGGDFKKITYGICLEKGVLCCLCKTNINKKNILYSLMYPLVFIGIITFIVGLVFKLPLLYILSILNISGCSGDIIMFIFMRKLGNDIEFSEYDNPVGFGIYSDKDISKIKHFGLNYIESKEKLERNDLKKIKVSYQSIIIFAAMIILGILIKLI